MASSFAFLAVAASSSDFSNSVYFNSLAASSFSVGISSVSFVAVWSTSGGFSLSSLASRSDSPLVSCSGSGSSIKVLNYNAEIVYTVPVEYKMT